MRHTLKRPCSSCPFRNDGRRDFVFLTEFRVREIAQAIMLGQSFACHNTLDFDLYDEETQTQNYNGKEQQCAGAEIFLTNISRGTTAMRQITERLGLGPVSELDMDAPVCRSVDELLETHRNAWKHDQRKPTSNKRRGKATATSE